MRPSISAASKPRVGIGGAIGVVGIIVGSSGRPGAGLLAVALGVVLIVERPATDPDRRPRLIADGGTSDIEMVVAIIRPAKLNDVKRALADAGAPSLTVTNVSGRGTQPTETGQWRGSDYVVDLHQKVKVEVAITDDQTDAVVDAIQEAAHTGKPGDGKIFVMPVHDACRVSTDERGVAAM